MKKKNLKRAIVNDVNGENSIVQVKHLSHFKDLHDEEIDEKLELKQDKLVEGENITIDDTTNEISCDIDISGKQDKTDNTLLTDDKTVVGAINYVFTMAGKAYTYKGQVETEADLPTDAEQGDVYNVSTPTPTSYAFNGTSWDNWGAPVDLSGYRTAAAQDLIDAGKQDVLTPQNGIEITADDKIGLKLEEGENITIEAGSSAGSLKISAAGGGAEYEGGDYIEIDGDVIDVTNFATNADIDNIFA